MSKEIATLGAGCFWCVEAVFKELKGVEEVNSGYMGGDLANPTYKAVCSGTTGHAEVARISYDSALISFEELLEVFFQVHDPTTLNRQGADVGTQYRSVIFFHDTVQEQVSKRIIGSLNESGAFSSPIVTEVTQAVDFYEAEDYHKDYFDKNADQPYCAMIVRPKVEKFKRVFNNRLK